MFSSDESRVQEMKNIKDIKDIKDSLIPESNATILARSAKSVKLDSYEKLQKIKC